MRRDGHDIIYGDATETAVLAEAGIRRASYLLCFLDNEPTSLQIAREIHRIYHTAKGRNRLQCFIHLNSLQLIETLQKSELLQQSDGNGLTIRFFNAPRMTARNFFCKFPVEYAEEIAAERKFRLIFFGFNENTQALIIQALRVLHFPAENALEIICLGENIEREAKVFYEKYPKINDIAPIHFREFEGLYSPVKAELSDKEFIPVVFTAFMCSDTNLNFALEIAAGTQGENFRIYCLNQDSDNMNALFLRKNAAPRIRFFGNLEYICQMELITREKQDALARAIHNDYLKLLQQSTASESAAYQTAWDMLSKEAKDANRAQADHIIYKYAAVGRIEDYLKNIPLSLSPTEIEQLAITEHRRWEAHRSINGWSFGENRDDAQKKHPSMVPWEALPEAEKQKDRDTLLRIPAVMAAVPK